VIGQAIGVLAPPVIPVVVKEITGAEALRIHAPRSKRKAQVVLPKTGHGEFWRAQILSMSPRYKGCEQNEWAEVFHWCWYRCYEDEVAGKAGEMEINYSGIEG
jgi:hypothetical protein